MSLNGKSDGNPGRKLKGAEIICESLLREGVEVIFGYPGGAILPFYDALWSYPQLRHILVRHEQAAAHAADGYSRVTGKVGVCFGTSGPGATNLVTGIATAQMDSVPMVVITGQVPRPAIGTDAFQETDIFGITLPIVKHSWVVRDPADLASIVAQAFLIAASGRPGPVLIDIPKDVGQEMFDYVPVEPGSIVPKGFRTSYRNDLGWKKAEWLSLSFKPFFLTYNDQLWLLPKLKSDKPKANHSTHRRRCRNPVLVGSRAFTGRTHRDFSRLRGKGNRNG